MSTLRWSSKYLSVNNVELTKAACMTFEHVQYSSCFSPVYAVICVLKGIAAVLCQFSFFKFYSNLQEYRLIMKRPVQINGFKLFYNTLKQTQTCAERTDMCRQVARSPTSSHQLHWVTNNPRPNATWAAHLKGLFTCAISYIAAQAQHNHRSRPIETRSQSCAST